MGENLNSIQRNILAWILSLSVLILVGVMGFTIREVAELQKRLPAEYVRLERYDTDQHRVENALDGLDSKIDKLLMRGP